MNDPVASSWHGRHGRKVEFALLGLPVFLVCNSLAAVLGFDAFFDPWRPRSLLMMSGALFINAALAFWRVRSMTVIVILGLISIGLLVASSVTTS